MDNWLTILLSVRHCCCCCCDNAVNTLPYMPNKSKTTRANTIQNVTGAVKEVRTRAFPSIGKRRSLTTKDRKPPTNGMHVKPAYCTALSVDSIRFDSSLGGGGGGKKDTILLRVDRWGSSDCLPTNS